MKDWINEIAPDFTYEEITCNCGCGEDRMSASFMKKIQAARTIAGISFVPTSAVRCSDHNKSVGGANDSEHVPDYMPDERCHGIDLKAVGSRDKWIIVDALIKAGITRIGIMKNAVHAGDGDTVGAKDPNVLFEYYK